MEAQPLHQRTFQGAQGEDRPFDRVTSGVVDKGRIAVEELGFHAVARHVDEAAPLGAQSVAANPVSAERYIAGNVLVLDRGA